MAVGQSQEAQYSEKLQRSDIVGQPSGNDNKIQKSKEIFLDSKEVQTKLKEKSKKENIKRSHSISPVFNESKRQKLTKMDKMIPDKTCHKSPQNGTMELNHPRIINKSTNDDKTYNQAEVKKTAKPIFSELENGAVKKRVEDFEKLGSQLRSNTPCNVTNKLKLTKRPEEKSKDNIVKTTKKSKLKVFSSVTPLKSTTKLIPPKHQTLTIPMMPSLKNIMSPKSTSALKTYRQLEKEVEVVHKRKGASQAKIDENKCKHEKKHLKAQQEKSALLKSKHQMIKRTEKLQSQKHNQIPSEEFIEVNQQGASESAINTLTKQVNASALKKLQKPIFLDVSAPLLPVDDCYDSEDERRVHHAPRPTWTKKNKMYVVSRAINFSGYECTNTMFMCQATTLDLQVLFGQMNPNKLRRTSSAIWSKPPRFTIMPIANEEDEENL